MIKKFIVPAALAFTPFLALAESNASLGYFESLLKSIYNILGQLTVILIGVGVVFFVGGLARFVMSTEPKQRENLKGYLLTGVVVLFVMTTLWGIVYWLRNILGIDAVTDVTSPGIPRPGN